MADVLTAAGIPTGLFSIDGQTTFLSGVAGEGPSQFIVGDTGLSPFNEEPPIRDMNELIKCLVSSLWEIFDLCSVTLATSQYHHACFSALQNNGTTSDSGIFGEIWSSKVYTSLEQQRQLKEKLDATTVNTIFPDTSTGRELETITRIMQTRTDRGANRDVFYLEDGGYDTHCKQTHFFIHLLVDVMRSSPSNYCLLFPADVDVNLIANFMRINEALTAFRDELVAIGLWEKTVV